MEFEWDLAKESENIRKHSVTFVEPRRRFLILTASSCEIRSIQNPKFVIFGSEGHPKVGC